MPDLKVGDNPPNFSELLSSTEIRKPDAGTSGFVGPASIEPAADQHCERLNIWEIDAFGQAGSFLPHRNVGWGVEGTVTMADVLVDCINKQPRNDPYEGITHLGGPGNGVRWKWTRQQVIDSINAKTNSFYTLVNGNRGDIGVVNGPNGPYVRTHADGKWNDNLLALPECG